MGTPERLVQTEVTYILEYEGRLFVVAHVPARVCRETGEQLFSPETVKHIQEIIESKREPNKVIEALVYDYV